jgi:hypothetical protein
MKVKNIGIFGAALSLVACIGVLTALSHSTNQVTPSSEPDATNQFTPSSEPETVDAEVTVSCEQTYSEFFEEDEVDAIDIVLVSHMKETTDLVAHLGAGDHRGDDTLGLCLRHLMCRARGAVLTSGTC